MAQLMSLGPHVFRVIGLNGRAVEIGSESVWAEFGRFGMTDGAHFTGMKRATQKISGILWPNAIGGLPDYEAIRASQYAGKPLPLLQMGRGFSASILGRVTIESVSDLSEFGGRKIAFDITLKGFV
ncbi:phage tail protein [Xanthobacter sp. 126]|uniref:phage tail protein n=1 Tax=Xanthobacter sp. 126 TaxID=1131814 RepID=UPI00045EA70D|nr:phage tail protein [Xanthobacter sp. 126]